MEADGVTERDALAQHPEMRGHLPGTVEPAVGKGREEMVHLPIMALFQIIFFIRIYRQFMFLLKC